MPDSIGSASGGAGSTSSNSNTDRSQLPEVSMFFLFGRRWPNFIVAPGLIQGVQLRYHEALRQCLEHQVLNRNRIPPFPLELLQIDHFSTTTY